MVLLSGMQFQEYILPSDILMNFTINLYNLFILITKTVILTFQKTEKLCFSIRFCNFSLLRVDNLRCFPIPCQNCFITNFFFLQQKLFFLSNKLFLPLIQEKFLRPFQKACSILVQFFFKLHFLPTFLLLLRLIQFFKKISASAVQNIDHEQTKYKSTLGGIITITIFTISLAYVVWIGYLWQTNQMSPKITRQNYVSDYSLLDLSEDVISLYYWKDYEDKIDPFENNILLPLIMYTKNDQMTEPQLITNQKAIPIGQAYREFIKFQKFIKNQCQNYQVIYSQQLYIYNQFYHPMRKIEFQSQQYFNQNLIVPEMKLGFSGGDGNIYASDSMLIEIVLCSEVYLKPDEKCASPELTEQFFAQPSNAIQLEFYTTSINPLDRSKQRGFQEFIIQIEEIFCYTVQSYFKTTLFQLQNYILFGYPEYKEYIVDVLLQTQTNSLEYCQKTYQNNPIAIVYLGMIGTQEKATFEYPRLGDLLANVGSIVSILFMIKYFIILLNEYFLNRKILNELISFYYPEFKKIKIQKNWRGSIVNASLNNNKIDAKNYSKFYEKVSNQMRQKASYLNLLYEISRLYFVMRSQIFRNEFQKSHQIGIKINLFQQKESDIVFTPKSEKSLENNYILNEDDAEILSYSRSQIDKNYDLIPEEMYDEVDYYYLNKIS